MLHPVAIPAATLLLGRPLVALALVDLAAVVLRRC